MRRTIPVLCFVLCWGPRCSFAQELGATVEKSGAIVTGVTFRVWSPLVSSNAAGLPANHRRKEVSLPMDGAARFLRLRITGP